MRLGLIVVLAIVIILSIFVTGCVSGPGTVIKNVTPTVSLLPAGLPVPPAPHHLFIKTGHIEQFTYWGHIIAVNYSSAYPTQIVKIGIDGSEKVIQKDLTERPNGIDWKEGNLSFTLKPVAWEIREGQNIPIYESTWNTNEVFFEVQVLLPVSEVTGGPDR